ncbi:MAG TPA: sulfotransferase [Povalibacter sp.]|nr:sulfotransferase [Povalibacter sp.]
MTATDACASRPPVAIGGVGGSGTRLVAQLLREAGVHIGGDLNQANDLLWFTLLFKREEILDCDDAEFDLLTQALVSGLRGGQPLDRATCALLQDLSARGRAQHPASWLRSRAVSLRDAARQPRFHGNWGWKEPNTHVVIERLWQRLPTLRYIHVVRHGLDMAYSSNQNQLHLWGPSVLGTGGEATPARSLAYWCKVHKRMQGLLAKNPDRMYWLDYDALCRDPEAELSALYRFLDYSSRPTGAQCDMIQPPRSRWVELDGTDAFDPADIAFVHSLGYDTTAPAGTEPAIA